MNSWWNLHVFSLRPRQRERRTHRSRSPLAHLSGAAAASRRAPHTSDRVQAAQQRGLVRDEKTNWVDLDGWYIEGYDSWYDMYLHMIYRIYIYIQIWNGFYLYMSSCHVDNAMVITTKSCQKPGSMNGKRPFYMVESCSTNIFDDRRLQRILGHVSHEITLKKIPSNSIPLIPCYILSIIPMMSV